MKTIPCLIAQLLGCMQVDPSTPLKSARLCAGARVHPCKNTFVSILCDVIISLVLRAPQKGDNVEFRIEKTLQKHVCVCKGERKLFQILFIHQKGAGEGREWNKTNFFPFQVTFILFKYKNSNDCWIGYDCIQLYLYCDYYLPILVACIFKYLL